MNFIFTPDLDIPEISDITDSDLASNISQMADDLQNLRASANKLHPLKFTGIGSETKYSEWIFDIESHVGAMGLAEKYTNGGLSVEEATIMYWFIRRALGGTALNTIKGVPTGDLAALTVALEEEYNPKRIRNKLSGLKTLITGSVTQVADVNSFVEKKFETYCRIKDQPIDHEDLLCLGLIDGVSTVPELATVADIALTRDNLKFKDVKQLITDKIGESGGDDAAKALKINASKFSNSNAGAKCSFCGNTGHYALKCYHRIEFEKKCGGQTQGRPDNNKKKEEKRCYKCGSTKHLKPDCPQMSKKAKAKLAEVDQS